MSQVNTILIVDDEPFGRDTLVALLQPQGYQLMLSGNGPDALEQAAARPPDLVLLDVMMPGMDGFEVCRRLRADPQLREVPVIMLTALDDRVSRLQGLEAGADDFISKPYDRVELRSRVRTITRLNRYRRLLAERSRLDWVIEQSDDGYLIAGEAGNILYANAQARLYLGIAPDAAGFGETFLELATKQYHCQPLADWSEWAAQPGAPTPRYLVRPPSSSADQFILQVDVIEKAGGPGERYLVRLRDMTASFVNQNSVWSFQGLVRHKLSTALSQVVGALRLLEDLQLQPVEGSAGELFEIALRGAARLQTDLQGIFHYIEAPDLLCPERGRCCLADLPPLLTTLAANLGLSPIQVVYQNMEETDDLWLAISLQGIELVLGELLDNARKFHPQQSPEVVVVLARSAAGVQIDIWDDGQTLAPDQLSKIWQPYYQAERFFTGQVAGMGLGLPMVAALLWRIGGSCRAYNRSSNPGVGVELVVPFAQPEVVPA